MATEYPCGCSASYTSTFPHDLPGGDEDFSPTDHPKKGALLRKFQAIFARVILLCLISGHTLQLI